MAQLKIVFIRIHPRFSVFSIIIRIMGGLYLLLMKLDCGAVIEAGALGARAYGAGWYVYAGSARAGLARRLARHARPDKKFHWHIDYLLERAALVRSIAYELPDAASEDLLRARLLESIKNNAPGLLAHANALTRTECLLAAAVAALPGAAAAAPRFGASDCRCAAHLFYFTRAPRLAF
jgi:sugar fermentation stimulation protein A